MAKKQSFLKTKKSFSGVQILLFVLAFAAVGAVAIWQSYAAPANKGGGHVKPSGQTLTGTITDTTYGVAGKGFTPGQLVALSIGEANGCCSATNRVADSTGSLSYTANLVGPGTYFVKASILSGSRWVVVAQWSGVAN
ncbi:hypothetical protein KW801_00030 [Candidatus Saccharibacteria bacterium]|nr:hypothetical protein [Candidatus Saccharibacteria bacterium]